MWKKKCYISEYSLFIFCSGNQLIAFLRYETIKCINQRFSKWPGSLWGVTCFCLGWRLPADFVSLEGPYVNGVKNPRLQTNHLVRGALTSHRDLSTGALGGRVAQHVALNFCLDSLPGDRHRVLCYFSGSQVGWGIQVWEEGDQDDESMVFLEKLGAQLTYIRELICFVECWKPIMMLSGLLVLIGCGFDPWPGHARSLKKMEPNAFLFGIQYPGLKLGRFGSSNDSCPLFPLIDDDAS